MDSPSTHVVRVVANSSILDGVVSVIFDLLILGVCHLLAQSICSSHNLQHVYDHKLPLSLHTSRIMLIGHGPIGHVRVTRILTPVLTICAVAAILIGFGINGETDDAFKPRVYASVISVQWPPIPLHLDYRNEFEVSSEQDYKRPALLSRRLEALDRMDWCQTCSYSHCEWIGYAFEDEHIDMELVPMETNLNSHCVTASKFRNNLVSWRYLREKTHAGLACQFDTIALDFTADEGDAMNADKPVTHMRGVPKGGSCDLDLGIMRCFRRPGQPVHCAAVGLPKKGSNQQRNQLVVFLDAEKPERADITPFAMRIHNRFSDAVIRKYLDNVAYFASLQLGYGAYKWDLMAFATIRDNVSLDVRDTSREVNVSDIDLRIIVPCVVILSTTLVVFAVLAFTMWFRSVYRKKRRFYNRFSTVPELLELLLIGEGELNKTRQDPSTTPCIGIAADDKSLDVQRQETFSPFVRKAISGSVGFQSDRGSLDIDEMVEAEPPQPKLV